MLEEEDKEEKDYSLKLPLKAALLSLWHMRMGGQSSPSPSHLPADSVRSVYTS